MLDDFLNQKTIPVTFGELTELTSNIQAYPPLDTPVQICANEERACIKLEQSGLVISWIKRHPQSQHFTNR